MKCSVFIATSVDGYIATPEGKVDWLQTAGDQSTDMSDDPDMGFTNFLDSVDCIIMGRKTMNVISAMNLTDEQWPYGNRPIKVLSQSLRQVPENLVGKVEIISETITQLISRLEQQGFKHAYVDGGTTITAFLSKELIAEMTITQAPVLLGDGVPLFGQLKNSIKLEKAKAITFANDFIQTRYRVKYS